MLAYTVICFQLTRLAVSDSIICGSMLCSLLQLVREDGEDKHLSRLIGPKLYEANWRDLTTVSMCVLILGYIHALQRYRAGGFVACVPCSTSFSGARCICTSNLCKCWHLHATALFRSVLQAGYLARVKVAEVWCPMTSEFYSEYLDANAQGQLIVRIVCAKEYTPCSSYLVVRLAVLVGCPEP